MHGESFGAAANGEGSHAWVALHADGELRLDLISRLRFLARVSAVVPTRRQHFVIEGVGAVHRPSVVAGRAALGLEVWF